MTLVLSEQCNFSCAYCPQRQGKNTLTIEAIKTFLDFLGLCLAEEVWLGFYGGEPLLSWPQIEKTVAYSDKKYKNRFRFTLTSNGSLLKKEHILFLKKHRFDLVLSYDGLAQKSRDSASITAVETALAELRELYPQGYMVNSVFTPRTVPLLAASIDEMLKQGHKRLQYALDMSVPWQGVDLAVLEDQLDRLATICLDHGQKTGSIPLENFKENKKQGIFACFAGRDRLALLPDNTVWGCYMFYDLLGHDPQNPDYAKYCYGTLDDFMSGSKTAFEAIEDNYVELRQDYFFSENKELCSLCDDLESCALCPVTAALASGTLAVIPSWTCEVKKIGRRVQARFAANPNGEGASLENTHA